MAKHKEILSKFQEIVESSFDLKSEDHMSLVIKQFSFLSPNSFAGRDYADFSN